MPPMTESAEPIAFTERGSGPPLVLVHGVMITGDMFEPVLDRFAARYRVIVPDLRGHGRSRGLPPPYTVPQLAWDLSRLLDRLDVPSAAVLGYSQGGAVAQQFALDYPHRCRRLVLACTYAFNAARAAEVVGLIADQDAALMVAAWRAAMAFDSRHRLREIACPTLVLAGADDAAVPLHHARMLHDGIPGSRLLVIDRADHALIWARPDEFTSVVEAFLGESS